ncbi:MAG: nucleoside hydrolase [Anaerolineae bacterium]|nr:nucleoside hydrolase [Anaerolineae bacterium]
MSQKILLDTDIGTDIDDAVCLAYLLAQPACDLVGVTTVSGEAHERAKMVSVLCKIAAQDQIPIFPGVEAPLLAAQRQPFAQQAEALARWDHAIGFPSGEAINFLRQTIRAHPGEIILLAIGPLTNIALLFALDRTIPTLLKELVIMGGHYVNRLAGTHPLEHNIRCDPHAAAIVFNSPVPMRAVGVEVTRRVVMQADEVRARFDTELLRPVLDFAEVWFRDIERITFHDPLAAAAIFDADLCTFERGITSVELTSEPLRGYTHWQRDDAGWHQVAATVDAAAFFAHFFSVFA